MKADQARNVIQAWEEFTTGQNFHTYVQTCPVSHTDELCHAAVALAPDDDVVKAFAAEFEHQKSNPGLQPPGHDVAKVKNLLAAVKSHQPKPADAPKTVDAPKPVEKKKPEPAMSAAP
jgi:hypothetical protein